MVHGIQTNFQLDWSPFIKIGGKLTPPLRGKGGRILGNNKTKFLGRVPGNIHITFHSFHQCLRDMEFLEVFSPLGGNREFLKNEEENFLGKVPGSIYSKFHYNPIISETYGTFGGFPT